MIPAEMTPGRRIYHTLREETAIIKPQNEQDETDLEVVYVENISKNRSKSFMPFSVWFVYLCVPFEDRHDPR